ncbi:MAG: DUF4399 domain-containing protein [Candidatus Thiodiazotropha sp. (ex Lucinoma borealis)]|nr:DUF4399 domain-containing protein [Candidatus Thiodiazotropha sp. (ex Lucinoma borealis)]
MSKKNLVSVAVPILIITLLVSTFIARAHTPPDDAKVYFIGLMDGAVVTSPFKVKFGIKGFGITPAGTKGKIRHTAGHHHLLIDVEQLPDLDEAIPRDVRHLHFDNGETEALLELSTGKHTLQLLLGDEDHEPQAPPLFSEKITITVE